MISARQSFSSSTTRAAHALPGKVEAASAPKPGAMIGREPELRALLISGMNGNAADYRAFLSLLAGFLRSFYRGKLGRVGRQGVEAEDLVQEALLAIHTRRDTYRTDEPVTPWIYAIARYKLIDYLRRTRSSLSDAPVEDAQHVPAPDGHTASESSLDLERLLGPLSHKMRMALRLVKIDGLSVDEASQRSGLSISDIKISVHRGLKAMAAAVAERDKS